MNEGIFPDELKVGKISPLYKKESEELLENYRPVSTIAIFGKIFEKVMFTRLHSFLTSQNLLYKNQYGFRKYHYTSHEINYSVDHVESCLKQQKNMILVY